MNQEALSKAGMSDDAAINEMFDMEVVDMRQTFGPGIDRESNSRIAYIRQKTEKP